MSRRLLLVATFVALALPVGAAHAEDAPPVVVPPTDVVTIPDPVPVYVPPIDVVTVPDCSVVIVVDGPVTPDGQQGPGGTVIVPCGQVPVIPPIVLDGPATVGTTPAAPMVAARIGYVPSWAAVALGL